MRKKWFGSRREDRSNLLLTVAVSDLKILTSPGGPLSYDPLTGAPLLSLNSTTPVTVITSNLTVRFCHQLVLTP